MLLHLWYVLMETFAIFLYVPKLVVLPRTLTPGI